MRKYYADIIQFRGDHEAFGYEQGKWLLGSPLFKIYQQQHTRTKRPRFAVNTEEATDWLAALFPALLNELKGISAAIGFTIEQTIEFFSGYQQEWKRSGCSILTGPDFLIRNYDFHPKTYEGRFAIYQPPSAKGYATIGASQRIVGRADGMNEVGLTVGYNFVNRRNPGNGFIPTIITRMLLEQCATNEEAISLIKKVPHRHSFNYVIADKLGNSHVIEATAQAIRVKESKISTNHFDMLPEANRYHLADSRRRYAILKKQPVYSIRKEQAFQLFNNIEEEIFSKKYSQSAGTLHTSLYDQKNLDVYLALGNNRKPTPFSFKNWLDGENTTIKKVIGVIDTDEKMPYMDGL
ncbi:C45 family autoproteolytic acyltransferase/hydolase [Paraliobacillus zengyii]|uniref:C45 family autoproteolytic acyltransferase/hydolase n=1 Tax=Paraliobacillus zengyii TaxID=2213194 RepID=UPI000DD47AB6|nr:C45 family peptidase [Paraliobacillus zengyii]